MTVPRFATLNSTWGYGLYLSKPGIDATTNADPANFLLHSNVKEEQVLMAGYAAVPPGGTAVATFPATMPSPPMFYMNFSTSAFGSQFLPFDLSIKTHGPLPAYYYAVTAIVSTTNVVFFGHMSNLTANLQYIVMARSG